MAQSNTEGMMYGFVGLQDFTLYPVIRPGSFVEINPHQKKDTDSALDQRTRFGRSTLSSYGSYACSWCQLDGHQLSVIPHPISRLQIRTYRHPDEAEIVGRVTAV